MEIRKDSDLYRKYRQACRDFAEFFDTYQPPRRTESFCHMMRMVYFWRPGIVLARITMLTLAALGPLVCLMKFPLELGTGLGAIVLGVGVIYGLVVLGLVINDRRIERQAELRREPGTLTGPSFLKVWFQSMHDRICPLVTFKEAEDDVKG